MLERCDASPQLAREEFITHFPKSTTLDLNPCTQADTAFCAVSSVLSDQGLVSESEEEKAAGW